MSRSGKSSNMVLQALEPLLRMQQYHQILHYTGVSSSFRYWRPSLDLANELNRHVYSSRMFGVWRSCSTLPFKLSRFSILSRHTASQVQRPGHRTIAAACREDEGRTRLYWDRSLDPSYTTYDSGCISDKRSFRQYERVERSWLVHNVTCHAGAHVNPE